MATKTKNDIKVGLIDGNTEPEVIPESTKSLIAEKLKSATVEEVPEKQGLLISDVDYPVRISYGNDTIRLSGRARERVLDISKLGELPKSVKLKEL